MGIIGYLISRTNGYLCIFSKDSSDMNINLSTKELCFHQTSYFKKNVNIAQVCVVFAIVSYRLYLLQSLHGIDILQGLLLKESGGCSGLRTYF